MLFVEFRFFWFFLAGFSIYWSLGKNDSREIWLLICGCIVSATWNGKFAVLLMASSVFDYVVGLMMTRGQTPPARRDWLRQP